MGYERHYSGDPKEIDEQAIKDIREYLTEEQWDIMMQLVGNPDTTIGQINLSLGFAGVSGRPFHAFCRRYMLAKYRAWMAEGPDPIPTDEEGYRLKDG